MKSFKAGIFVSEGLYRSFHPEKLCRPWQIDDMGVISLLSRADRYLGRLDMYSEYVDIDMFIQMHIAKEAVKSSEIEGTQTNMEDAFLGKDDIATDKKNDWEEVQNYIEAMNSAVGSLNELPFSSRLIKKAHEVLLHGVRGNHKQPGEYRRSQNWIGGASINDAVFVPPPHNEVAELVSDIEKFANNPKYENIPELIKIALIHYQFETIHPFLDGNGRVGRLMITLYLVSQGILKKPILYLSDFFERNRSLYYDNLMRVRTHNDINQWLKFFLTGIIETSKNGVETLDAIMQLQRETEEKIAKLGGRSADAKTVVTQLYKRPIVSVKDVVELIHKTPQSAYSLISELERQGVLREITGDRRNRLYVFAKYIELF